MAEVTASVKAAPLGVNSAMSSTRPRDHLLTAIQTDKTKGHLTYADYS